MNLSYDVPRNILLIRFDGAFTDRTLDELCSTIEAFVNDHAGCRGILDMSDVTETSVAAQHIVSKAENKPIFHGARRVIVAPTTLLYALARMFQMSQDLAANGENTYVVHTMQEAYDFLNVTGDDFIPV